MGRFFVLMCLVVLVLPASADGHGAGVTGTLVDLHGHRSDGTEVDQSYALTSSDGMRRLADDQPATLIGQQVEVDDADPAAGLQGQVAASSSQRVAPAVAPGPRSLLVIVLTTPDAPGAAATPDVARAGVFGAGSANALYVQQSGGATRFVGLQRADGDVAGPLAIGVSTTGCNEDPIAAAADAAARSAGWAVDAYDHVLYLLPHTGNCEWAGLGQLPGRRLWSNGSLAARVIAHELGHNLGAHHANSARCTGAGGVLVSYSATCVSAEYGDPFDVLGLQPRLMSSWHRAQIGQLPTDQSFRVQSTQTLSLISSDDFLAAGPRLVLIPRKDPRVPVTRWFALELRSTLGPFDEWSSADPVTTGISVRAVPDLTVPVQSQLLDARPDTASYADAPLQVGQTMRDDAHGIAIRLNSIAGPAASVTVTMPLYVDDVPPSAPAGLQLIGNTNAVSVRWSAAEDDEAIARYDVERDGVVIGTTPGLGFEDVRVAALTLTSYRVVAVDTSGNRTASAVVGALLADVTPPGAVPGLRLSARGAQVTASWGAAADNRAIRAYRVARDGALLSDVAGFSFSERPPAGRHTYSVAAIDGAGNIGPQTSLVMPSATTGSSVVKPRIALVRRRRSHGVVTFNFTAAGATAMSAIRSGKRVASASGARLRVRLRVPRHVKRPTVKIVASSWAGETSRRFVIR